MQVNINWYPGHMAKALKQIKEKATIIDLFIVVLDARAPLSTYNEDFDAIMPGKPRLFVFSKVDLADRQKLEIIKKRFNNERDKVLLVDLKKVSTSRTQLVKSLNSFVEKKHQTDLKKGYRQSTFKIMVIGVPNSGKSTLINVLSQSSKTKVADTPGVTRGQQWVSVQNMLLLDTPGVLWPKMNDSLIAIKLLIIGSIKADILPKETLFNLGYKLLSNYYPQKILDLKLTPSQEDVEIYSNLYKLCEIKNFIIKNQKPDIDKSQSFFINYLRKITGVTYDD